MKKRVSATIDERTERILRRLEKDGRYRNLSHVIEEAILTLDAQTKGARNED